MKQKALVIALATMLVTGFASLEVVAGKGGGGGAGGGGMPGMGGSGMSKGSGAGPGSSGVREGMSGMGGSTSKGQGGMSGMGGNAYEGQGVDRQSMERHRVGEKDDVGVRSRSADQAW